MASPRSISPVDRRRFLAAAAAALVLPAIADAADTPETSPPLRVLTYNIRYDNPDDGKDGWQHRRGGMAKFIAVEKVDIAGLQEVLARQAADLAKRLPDYDWYGVGRDDGQQSGEFCPIFYRRERLERLDAGTFWLSTTPDKAGSKGWDAALPRICSWLKLRDKKSGSEFYLFNTHFDHRGELARKLSAALIRIKVSEIAGKSPVVVTGDFNGTVEETPYKTLTAGTAIGSPLKDAQIASAKAHEGPDSTWNGFREIVPRRRIDFIFVQQGAVQSHRILDPRVAERFLSDHLPVIAEVEMQP